MVSNIFKKVSQIFGYVIISLTALLVLIRTIFSTGLRLDRILWLIILAVIGIFLISGLSKHGKELLKSREQESQRNRGLNYIKIIFACFLGSLVTHYLSVSWGFGPFIASGLVGIIVAMVSPKFAPCVYAASFAGMSSQNVLPTIFHSVIVGIIVGIVFIICKTVFDGFGGKLGVIAFFSVWLIFSFSRLEVEVLKVPDLIEGLGMVLSCIFGAIATYLLSVRMKTGPVMASSIVTLIGGIFLPPTCPLIAQNLASGLTAGTYAGMSSKEIIRSNPAIGLAGMIAGIILVLGFPVFYGWGGKLGVVAFIGVTCVRGLRLKR